MVLVGTVTLKLLIFLHLKSEAQCGINVYSQSMSQYFRHTVSSDLDFFSCVEFNFSRSSIEEPLNIC